MNPNSSYGRALLDMIASRVPAFGDIFVVKSSSDTADNNYYSLQQVMKTDSQGRVRLFNDIETAYAAMQSNNNDVMLLDAHTTYSLTAMLTVAKNRCHFFGVDGGGHITAQGAKIQLGVTTAATDLAPVLVTGVRNSFRNVKVINANTNNNCLYGFIDNGEGTVLEDFSSVKIAGLDDANHAHFWMAGDSLSAKRVTFGQSNIPSSAAGFGILIDGKTGGGTDGTVKENFLEDVRINMSVANGVVATSAFIKVADNSALNFVNEITRLKAHNFKPVGAAALSVAIIGAANTVAGQLDLVQPAFFGCTGVGGGATTGINISAAGVAPVAAGGLATALTD